MSKDLVKAGLRLVTFAAATSCSLMFTTALLRNPLSRGVVGLILIGGLLLAVLTGFAKYLMLLWMWSDRTSTFVVRRLVKPVTQPATHNAEQA